MRRDACSYHDPRHTPALNAITSDIVRALVARRGTESETTRAHRLTLIREVCRFLALDDPRTFIPAARFLGIQRRTVVTACPLAG